MPETLKPNFVIRAMKEQDLASVAEMERKITEGILDAWDQSLFASCLKIYHAFVVEIEHARSNEIIGFLVLAIYDNIKEAHVLNIGVADHWQHQGVGSSLLAYMLKLLNIRHRSDYKIFLEVRVNNSTAINLYKKFAFMPIGIRKNYYTCVYGKEDAMVLVYSNNNKDHHKEHKSGE